ncbi:AceF Pyruvate/2-oxoglutarate dehydrogenase complex, dihydrolipoamide acyltransferase (E2) component, and related enzymes [Candidatus Nanopelagicaceae bacterium]
MSFSVTMPALGESVSEGTVTRWLKNEGDMVAVDEPLLEVSTDKVDTEIPSPVAGILSKIVVGVDQTVAVGAELAVIADSAGTSAPAPTPAAPAPAPVIETPAPAPVAAAPTPPPAAPVATPAAPAGGGTVITMPALGESVSEGTVTRWLKNVGDSVAVDEALLEVSTDKVDTEIPSPVAGTLLAIDVAVDTTVPVGARLGLIGVSGAAPAPVAATPAPTPAPVAATPAPTPPPAPVAPTPVAPAAPVSQPQDAYVTPIVRKLANDLGVNLASVRGTGIGGRIRKEDVESAAPKSAAVTSAPVAAAAPQTPRPAAPVASPLRGTTVTMSRLRKVIAARMVESLQVSAQLTTVIEVDVTKIARLRDRSKATFEGREGVKLSFLPFFAVAVCEALKQHPVLNSSVEGDQIIYHGAEHLGIAVDTERGLLVPVIHNAGDLNMGGVARKIADLAARTRDNKVTPDELGGGTFTLTNTGSRGALFDTPIINQPQVAILGLGAVVKRPMVVKGEDGGETIAIRSMVYLGLSYDHRVVDGADAARFLVTLKERLEGGAFEADLGL